MALWLAVMAGGCASSGPTVMTDTTIGELYQRQWDLQSIVLDGAPDIMHVDAHIKIVFVPGQAAGFTGVNRFAGTYKIGKDGRLEWTALEIAGERMKGAPELMNKERNFLTALRKTNSMILSKHTLVLQKDDGTTALQFVETGY
jgi:heat shock protein HslJ